jgi:hypothetical protein
MEWWRRRDRAQRVEAKAKALIEAFGDAAYTEARQRESRADTVKTANVWRRVALRLARMNGRRMGLDMATRMAMDADLSGQAGEAELQRKCRDPKCGPDCGSQPDRFRGGIESALASSQFTRATNPARPTSIEQVCEPLLHSCAKYLFVEAGCKR